MSIFSFSQLEDLWIQAGGKVSAAAQAAAVAMAESSGNSDSINPTDNGGKQTSWGLWQISDGTHNQPTNVLDPATNAAMAVAKYNAAGGTFANDWGTYGGAAYTANLSKAYAALPQALASIGNTITGTPSPSSTSAPSTGQNTGPGWNIFAPGYWGQYNPFNVGNWTAPFTDNTSFLSDPSKYAPLLIGIGVLLIGLVVILSNHEALIEKAAEAG